MENNSRFKIDNKTKIEEKYVLYVEDLYVSFKGNSAKNQLENKIKNKKNNLKLIKKISSKEKLNELKLEIKELENELKDVNLKKKVVELKKELKVSDKNRKKEIQEEIKKTNSSMIKNSHGRKRVLNGVTLGLRQGETLAIVGANGAGKTVLLETILGFNIPDKYKKMILNLGHKKYSDNLKEVGIQYQQAKMPPTFKVKEAIKSQMKLYGKKIDKAEVLNMIEKFGILDILNSNIESLSGGQKQRLNLLLAVMHQPKIMILDEFITGLDVNSVRKIISYVNELKFRNNSSMIIISHQPEEIEALADRIVTMKSGVITGETDVASVLKEYGTMSNFVEEMI